MINKKVIFLNSNEHTFDLSFSENLLLCNYARLNNYNFCDLKKISSTFKSYFNVEFLDIKICFKILSKIKSNKFIIDKNSCSYFFDIHLIPSLFNNFSYSEAY